MLTLESLFGKKICDKFLDSNKCPICTKERIQISYEGVFVCGGCYHKAMKKEQAQKMKILEDIKNGS